jgi:hypothetical protein
MAFKRKEPPPIAPFGFSPTPPKPGAKGPVPPAAKKQVAPPETPAPEKPAAEPAPPVEQAPPVQQPELAQPPATIAPPITAAPANTVAPAVTVEHAKPASPPKPTERPQPVLQSPVAPAVRVSAAAPIIAPRVEPSIESQAEIAQLAASTVARPVPAAPMAEYEPELEDATPFANALGGKPLWFWVATVAGIWLLAMIFWLIFLPQFRGPDYERRKREMKQQPNQKTSQPADSKGSNP